MGTGGYRFLRVFNAPCLVTHPQDFWGRWHVSLSGWLPFQMESRALQTTYRLLSWNKANFFCTALSGATNSAIDWTVPQRRSYSQRKTFAESTVQKRNDRVSAATSPMWVNHVSPFQIPLSRFTA